MKQKVKDLRVQIDGLAQLTKGLKVKYKYNVEHQLHGEVFLFELNQSPQIEKAVDSLYLAKAWLGKVLGALGEDSPYPKDGTRKTVKDIEPTADRNEEVPFGDTEGSLWRDKSHIEKVDWLRQESSEVVKEVKVIPITLKMMSDDVNMGSYRAEGHLSEARFQLGFELERIRKNG